ncbi:MAG: alcohol dehydrogenase catalytic domain-containing protein [bacterium]
MQVAVYYKNKDVRIEDRPKPVIGSQEILLKVKACGICGTDTMEWYRIQRAPLILGHEATGEIVEIGEEVDGYKIGDRVFVSHHVPCNTCSYCLRGYHTACETLHKTNYDPGGFSEYIRVPELNVRFGVYRLDGISFVDGTLIEPLACVVRGQRIAKIEPGQKILVIGAGVSGILHIALAKAKGAESIIATDINKYRLMKAEEAGADIAVRPEDLGEIRADRVIVATSAISAANLSFSCVDKGGTILFFAVPDPSHTLSIPITKFWRDEITVCTSYGASPGDLAEAVELIKKDAILADSIITHRLSFDDIQEGFRLVAEQGESEKVVVVL